MQALAQAFSDLSVVVAADWSAPPVRSPDHMCRSFQRDTTPDEVVSMFVEFAGAVTFGLKGNIHPEWHESPRLYGHWSF